MRIAVVIALLGIVGCGAGGTSPEAGSAGATELRISYWAQGQSSAITKKWTLRCAPAGGTLPQAAAACQRLSGMQNPFAPIPRDAVCTDQYGGPQVALVTGTFRGRALWTKLQRRNGCEIARFKRLGFLVPAFGASGEA